MKHIDRIVLPVAILLATAIIFAAEAPTLEQRMWQIAQKKEALPKGEKCRVLEKFPLIAMHYGFGQDATALAAVFEFEMPMSLADPTGGVRLIVMMQLSDKAEKEGCLETPGAQERFDEFFALRFKPITQKVAAAVAQIFDNPEKVDTIGLLNAALMESYLKGTPRPSLEAAVRKIAADNLIKPDIRTEDKPAWDSLVKAIDGSIPVILQGKQGPTVAVGYYQGEKEQMVFVYDPTKAELWTTSEAEQDKGKPAPDFKGLGDPDLEAAFEQEIKKKIVVDYKIDLSRDLPPGLIVKPWAEVQDGRAIYLGENKWPTDIDNVYKELKAYLDSAKPAEKK